MSKKYLDSAGLNKFASMVLSKFAAKNHSHSSATTNSAGFMSANDKVKLDGVSAGANKTIVDSTLSSTSVNAIQNKAVKTALDSKAASSHTHPTAQITGLDSALAGKASASHTHSADNITSGVLPIGRGGTGASNSVGAASTMLNALEPGTAAPRDDDWYVAKYAEDGNNTPVKRTHSALWSYIKSKCDGLYQPRGSYASSSHTHTIANVSNLQSTLDSKASVSHTHSNATATASGFMSNTDKSKLDGVSTGANKTIVDASFSATSTNPVQNKVVKAALDAKAPSSHTHTTSQVSGLDAALAGKAAASHNHDSVYAKVGHSHNYAGSSSAGGSANTSQTLNTYPRMDYGWSGVNYFNQDLQSGNAAKANNAPVAGWWHIMRFNHANSNGYYTDLAIPFNNPHMYYKRVTNGALPDGGWVKMLDANNYNSYAPTRTGGGASGTWGINVTGSAGSVPWSGVTGKPSTFAPSSHSHDWNSITNKPSSFPATSHTHAIANITGLQAALDGKQPKGSYAASSHNHDAGNITSGTLSVARGGTGQTSVNGIRGAIGINPVTTGGTGAAYTASVGGITSLATGASFIMVPHATSTSTSPTLNVNGLGAKPIRRRVSNGTATTITASYANWLGAGKPIRVIYDGSYWIADFDRPAANDIYGAISSGQIADNSISLAKLASDVGTVYVGSNQPSDSNVKIWIQV